MTVEQLSICVSVCDSIFNFVNNNSLCDEADVTDDELALSVFKHEVAIGMPFTVETNEVQLTADTTLATEQTYPVAVEATCWEMESETEQDDDETDITAVLDKLEGSCRTKLLVVSGTSA